jgi:hypothetical protein
MNRKRQRMERSLNPTSASIHLVRGLIANELHIDNTQMLIERINRLGGAGAKQTGPIIAKFHHLNNVNRFGSNPMTRNPKTG